MFESFKKLINHNRSDSTEPLMVEKTEHEKRIDADIEEWEGTAKQKIDDIIYKLEAVKEIEAQDQSKLARLYDKFKIEIQSMGIALAGGSASALMIGGMAQDWVNTWGVQSPDGGAMAAALVLIPSVFAIAKMGLDAMKKDDQYSEDIQTIRKASPQQASNITGIDSITEGYRNRKEEVSRQLKAKDQQAIQKLREKIVEVNTNKESEVSEGLETQ